MEKEGRSSLFHVSPPPILLTIGQSKMHVLYEQRGNHQYAHGGKLYGFHFLYMLAETRFLSSEDITVYLTKHKKW